MILIKNGRVIDPAKGTDDVMDMVIDGGKIKAMGHYPENGEYETVIDASGLTVGPGLIDVHVHFRDPGLTYKEDIGNEASGGQRRDRKICAGGREKDRDPCASCGLRFRGHEGAGADGYGRVKGSGCRGLHR